MRSACPLAATLDLVGDKWTFLIIRDIALGKHCYSELAGSAEQIPTNLLASRLKRMIEAELLIKTKYISTPPRYKYELTMAGKELMPAMLRLAQWGLRHCPGTEPIPAGLPQRDEAENKKP